MLRGARLAAEPESQAAQAHVLPLVVPFAGRVAPLMRVQRVVANMKVPDPSLAQKFYGEILGLDLLMDMNWIR